MLKDQPRSVPRGKYRRRILTRKSTIRCGQRSRARRGTRGARAPAENRGRQLRSARVPSPQRRQARAEQSAVRVQQQNGEGTIHERQGPRAGGVKTGEVNQGRGRPKTYSTPREDRERARRPPPPGGAGEMISEASGGGRTGTTRNGADSSAKRIQANGTRAKSCVKGKTGTRGWNTR